VGCDRVAIAEVRISGGRGIELVGEANVLCQTQAPPQGDIVDHHILTVHHVRDDIGGPLVWDLGFLAFGTPFGRSGPGSSS